MVESRHAFVVPAQVSRRKIWRAVMSPLVPKLEEVDKNATNRPSGLIAGCRLGPSPGTSVSVTDTPIVEGVQSSRVPAQVSRKKTCDAAAITPGIMFDALEMNATYRPSALRVGIVLAPFACWPPRPTDARDVDGEHGSATPAQVSWTKMSSLRFVSSAIIGGGNKGDETPGAADLAKIAARIGLDASVVHRDKRRGWPAFGGNTHASVAQKNVRT